MAKQFYIYSTLSNNQNYTAWKEVLKGQEQSPRKKEQSVLINGGANVVDKKALITPEGVETIIDEKKMEILNACPMFKRHVEAGFIKALDKKHEATDVAKNMTKKDKSAPLTPAEKKTADK